MSKTVRQIQVFISSPGDMKDERAAACEICKEITRDIGSQFNFVLEPLTWEVDVASDRAERSQMVITKQLSDYDIYVGIMGFYFGSGTGTHSSGTEEEFEDAISANTVSGAPKIQFYFSSAKVDPGKIDIEQYGKVKNFKESIGDRGVFYKEFSDLVQFQTNLRFGLSRHAIDLSKEDASSENINENSPLYSELSPYSNMKCMNSIIESDPHVAFEFMMCRAVWDTNLLTSATEVMTEDAKKIRISCEGAVRELDKFNKGFGTEKKLTRQVNRLMDNLEAAIVKFPAQMSRIQNAFEGSMSSYQRAYLIGRSLSDFDRDEFDGTIEAILATREVYSDTVPVVKRFADTLFDMPELNSRFDMLAKVYSGALQDFAWFLLTAVQTMDEAVSFVSERD